MLVRRVAAAIHRHSLLVQAVLLPKLVVRAVEVRHALRDHDAVVVVPGARPDAVFRVDRGLAGGRLGAEVSAPGLSGDARRIGQRLAMRVSAGETTELRSVTRSGRGDEEAHGSLRTNRRGDD